MRRILLALALVATPAIAADRYLAGAGVALGEVLPPPPGDDAADVATFRATRALEGTPRWRQAIADVDEGVPAILAGFAPTAARDLSLSTTPALAMVLTRMRPDLSAAVNAVKPVYARPRPFVGREGAICQPRAALTGSFDYPSGHASWGNAVALVLAELIPGRADAILQRGRDYGDSRVICGAHSASAVAAGRVAAAAVVARLHGDAAFRADLEAARRDLDPAARIMTRIANPDAGTIVVAHRGCHATAPGLASAPENTILALDHCVAIGVDVMETDVRMTRDGHLVMIHDATVDRTTDGTGRVADLTLAQVQVLHLREDLGGADAKPTDQHVPTLDNMLAAATGRIVLNLDIKDAVHAETIAAVQRAGAQGRVLIKATAGIASAPLAALPPFDTVPFLPMLSSATSDGTDLPAIVVRQASATRRPIGVEVPRMSLAMLPATVAAARASRARLWANSLWDGYIAGLGGDAAALANPDAVWGRMIRAGVSIIQTDQPSALRRFLDTPDPRQVARAGRDASPDVTNRDRP